MPFRDEKIFFCQPAFSGNVFTVIQSPHRMIPRIGTEGKLQSGLFRHQHKFFMRNTHRIVNLDGYVSLSCCINDLL